MLEWIKDHTIFSHRYTSSELLMICSHCKKGTTKSQVFITYKFPIFLFYTCMQTLFYGLKTILLMKLLHFLLSIYVLLKFTFGLQNAKVGTAECQIDFPYYYYSSAQNSTCHMIPLFTGCHTVVMFLFFFVELVTSIIVCIYPWKIFTLEFEKTLLLQ